MLLRILTIADMLADFDIYEVGKQYCVFDSDLLRFKPDYSKLSIADLDDYGELAWLFYESNYTPIGFDIRRNRLAKTFRLLIWTKHPHTIHKTDLYTNGNLKEYENFLNLMNIKYGLLSRNQIISIINENNADVGRSDGEYRWFDTEHRISCLIENIERMAVESAKEKFGSNKTRKHFLEKMTSLTAWEVFLNSGIFG